MSPWLFLAAALAAPPCIEFGAPKTIGRLEGPVRESSGLARSAFGADRLYTHDDSGGGATLYALNLKGRMKAIISVTAARNFDWEDIGQGPCGESLSCLFLGDIGDNEAGRTFVRVYRIPEPSAEGHFDTVPAVKLQIYYPDGARDVEALMVDPVTTDLFLVEKSVGRHPKVAVLRRAGYLPAGAYSFESLGRISAGVLVTGADIDPTGEEAVLRGYGNVATRYQLVRDDKGNIARMVRTGQVEVQLFGEAIVYSADGGVVYTTTEGSEAPLSRSACKRWSKPKRPPPPSAAPSKKQDAKKQKKRRRSH